jgi:hypothetical protein
MVRKSRILISIRFFFVLLLTANGLSNEICAQHIDKIQIESVVPVRNIKVICRGIKEHSVTQDIIIFSDSLNASPTGSYAREFSIPKLEKKVLAICIQVFVENEYRGSIQFRARRRSIRKSMSLRIFWVGVGLDFALDR